MNHAKLLSEAFEALERYERGGKGMKCVKCGSEKIQVTGNPDSFACKCVEKGCSNQVRMKAGRELDALIAENVFGVEVSGELIKRYIDGRWWVELPHYSTNIADSWIVVEKLKDMGLQVAVIGDKYTNYLVSVCEYTSGHILADIDAETAPLAICLAALKAVGVEVEG